MSIFVNSVSHGIYNLVNSNSIVTTSGFCVELDEVFNTDPNKTPWVGVYFDNVTIIPRVLGITNINNGWLARYTYRIFVQDVSMEDGRIAKDLVNKGLTYVFDALNGDHTLLGSVDTITECSIAPFERNLDEEQWMFSDEIILVAQVDA